MDSGRRTMRAFLLSRSTLGFAVGVPAARVYRDHLRRLEDTARWFGRALKDASPGPGAAMPVTRERP